MLLYVVMLYISGGGCYRIIKIGNKNVKHKTTYNNYK